MSNIYFLGFYTEGPEIDGCYDLTGDVQKIKDKISPYFKDMFIFSKRDLKKIPGSDLFCNEYEEELDKNPNSNKIGYFDFKPFLIKYVLDIIPENSILLYHDINFSKIPPYWHTDWENIERIAEFVLRNNNSDFFAKIEHGGAFVKNFVKAYTVRSMFNEEESDIVYNCKLINAAQIFFRNNNFSKEFVSEWGKLCLRKDFIQKSPNENPHPEFQWNCGDQDVLNCLIYRYVIDGKLNPDFPKYSFKYRVIRMENKPFDFPNQSWNPHPTGIEHIENPEIIQYIKNRR